MGRRPLLVRAGSVVGRGIEETREYGIRERRFRRHTYSLQLKFHFFNSAFSDALCHYQRALALAITDGKNEMAPVIHLNMAAALLALKRYPETVEEAKKALDAGADKKKAFYQ
jgi:tetratricopeptide (TPR) repeat protein